MGRSEFASYSKELREKAGLTQAQISKSLKLTTPQMVSNWERGLCYPPLALFKSLAQLYKIDLESFFDAYAKAVREDLWAKVKRGKKRI